MQLFSQYKDIISPCNIDKNVILQHQNAVDEAFSRALLDQDHQVIDMYTKLGIKSQEQLVINYSDQKTHQQSLKNDEKMGPSKLKWIIGDN